MLTGSHGCAESGSACWRPACSACGGTSQQSLEDILKAYAGYNPKIGYCQGMGMIAGMLLLHMPAEVQTDSFAVARW